MNLRRWLTVGIGVSGGCCWRSSVCSSSPSASPTCCASDEDRQPGGPLETAIDVLTLRFLPIELRGIVVIAVGLALFGYGAYRLIGALIAPLEPFAPWDRDQPLVELIYQKRFLARGPRVVAIGGGTGALDAPPRAEGAHHQSDRGRDRRRRRRVLRRPPRGARHPGRRETSCNCIVALADAEPLMGQLLQYRFPTVAHGWCRSAPADADHRPRRPRRRQPLAGGARRAGGDFEEGVRGMNRILAVRGQVVPDCHAHRPPCSSVDGRTLVAGSRGSRVRRDRAGVADPGRRRLGRRPARIADADLIVIGPGSLYTSLLPGLLLPEVRGAGWRRRRPGLRLQRRHQDGETPASTWPSRALGRHLGTGVVDVVLANNRFDARAPGRLGSGPRPSVDGRSRVQPVPRLVLDDVVDPDNATPRPGSARDRVLRNIGARRATPSDGRRTPDAGAMA